MYRTFFRYRKKERSSKESRLLFKLKSCGQPTDISIASLLLCVHTLFNHSKFIVTANVRAPRQLRNAFIRDTEIMRARARAEPAD